MTCLAFILSALSLVGYTEGEENLKGDSGGERITKGKLREKLCRALDCFSLLLISSADSEGYGRKDIMIKKCTRLYILFLFSFCCLSLSENRGGGGEKERINEK